jgi:hydrogenase/urease accessory protein HupE
MKIFQILYGIFAILHGTFVHYEFSEFTKFLHFFNNFCYNEFIITLHGILQYCMEHLCTATFSEFKKK